MGTDTAGARPDTLTAKPVCIALASPNAIGGTERRLIEVLGAGWRRGSVTVVAGPGTSSVILDALRAMPGVAVQPTQHLAGYVSSLQRRSGETILAFGRRPVTICALLRQAGLLRSTQLILMLNGLEHGRRSDGYARLLASRGGPDLVITNSVAAGRHATMHLGIPPDRLAVVPSAIGDEWLEGSLTTTYRGSVPLVAMVGNARPEKNQAAGIRAFIGVRAEMLARLRVYTNDASELLAAVPTVRTSRDIEIVEGHTVTPQDLDQVDVLLHPSISESSPRTVLEALARGCLVVATAAGDTGDYVRPPHVLLDGSDDETIRLGLATAIANVACGGRLRTRPGWIMDRSLTAYVRALDEAVAAA
jgi:glycosyltransferase involved in cell wall biosynthesis